MTNEDLLDAYGTVRLCHPKILAIRRDHDAARAEETRLTADVRRLEAQWLAEKMNSKKAQREYEAALVAKDAEIAASKKLVDDMLRAGGEMEAGIAALRQRVEELGKDAATCCRTKRGMCVHGNVW